MKTNIKNTLPPSDKKGEIVLYQPDESIRLEVRLEDETVWLTQAQMAELFDVKEHTITYHIKEIYKCKELDIVSTARKIRVVRKEGNRNVNRQLDFYNLDMILSVGYRVNSVRGIMFRRWSSEVLKQFMLRGYSINQHLISLQERIDNRFSSLESQVEDHEQKIDFLINKEQPVNEQIFSTGCVWDAYTFVSNLVRSATKRVVLIDSFVDERTLLVLDKRAEGVACDIYTRFNYKLQLDLQKHEQQCRRIIVTQFSKAIHDRYLIIDDELWLLGASVKDMGRGLCTIIKLGFSPEEILKRI